MSELLAPIDGAIAEGGGDFKVCVESIVFLEVLLVEDVSVDVIVLSDVVVTVCAFKKDTGTLSINKVSKRDTLFIIAPNPRGYFKFSGLVSLVSETASS